MALVSRRIRGELRVRIPHSQRASTKMLIVGALSGGDDFAAWQQRDMPIPIEYRLTGLQRPYGYRPR